MRRGHRSTPITSPSKLCIEEEKKGAEILFEKSDLRSSAGPDGLIHCVEKFKAESVLLAGPLYQLTSAEDDCSNPVAALHFL